MSYMLLDACRCLPVLDVESFPLDYQQAFFFYYIQWLIFLLIGNTMENTMLKNFS